MVDDPARQRVRETLQEFRGRQGALLDALLHIQYDLGYIPEFAIGEASAILGVSQPEVWGVLTFYADFRVGKQAGHFIDVCVDGPCHVAGAPRIRRALEEVTARANGRAPFEVRNVSCPGICAKAPVIAIDQRYHADVTPEKAAELAQGLG